MSYGRVKMMRRIEKDPRFRTAMYLLILTLLLGYVGVKTWHIRLAIAAYDGQAIEGGTKGAAK